MENAFKKVTDSFAKDLKAAITKAWPSLVAAELLKIQAEAGKPKPVAVKPTVAPKQLVEERYDTKIISDAVILDAFDAYGGKSAAARALHMPESTFRERLKKAQAAITKAA